jgi:hypothetical protein
MGKKERANFRKELEKLSKIYVKDETPEYLEQNRRTAEAEKKCTLVERIIVRNQVD